LRHYCLAVQTTLLFLKTVPESYLAIGCGGSGCAPGQRLDGEVRSSKDDAQAMSTSADLDLLDAYRIMWLIPIFEDRVQDLLVQGDVSGTTHLCREQAACVRRCAKTTL
jgi:hypothetical protein